MLSACRPDMSERDFRDVSRLVYLTAMTKAGSNAGFFTAAHVFLSSGTVIQILHTGLTAGSCKWHIFSKIAKVTFPRHVWHKLSPGKKRKAHEKLTPDSLSTKNKRGAFVFMKHPLPGATRTGSATAKRPVAAAAALTVSAG